MIANNLIRMDKEKKISECKECMHALHLLIDGEASNSQKEFLEKHIEECMPCYQSYNLDKNVKEVLKNKIEKKTVPSALIANIKDKLNESF